MQVRVLPPEAQLRRHQAEATRLVARDRLNTGKLLALKTAGAEHATLCAYVKVDDLLGYLGDLVQQVGILESTPPTGPVFNPRNPWVGGDSLPLMRPLDSSIILY